MRKRIIPCLDVDDGRVVKGTRFVDLTDEDAETYIDTQNFSPRVVTNRPRTIGLRFSYRFN